MCNTPYGCGSENIVSNVRTEDSDLFDFRIRTTILGESITLDISILAEAHDWSEGRFPAGPSLAFAAYGCAQWLSSVLVS